MDSSFSILVLLELGLIMINDYVLGFAEVIKNFLLVPNTVFPASMIYSINVSPLRGTRHYLYFKSRIVRVSGPRAIEVEVFYTKFRKVR